MIRRKYRQAQRRIGFINIITNLKSPGLYNDALILSSILKREGYGVLITGWKEKILYPGKFKINIHLERVITFYCGLAAINIFIPNPEWFAQQWDLCRPVIDLVLCKTMDAQKIFERLGSKTVYTSFTSHDRYRNNQSKIKEFVHIAGKSQMKGTRSIIELWNKNPGLPCLHLFNYGLALHDLIEAPNIDYRFGPVHEEELNEIFNRYYFHLCPSEYEGFGHYINEAKSTGAIVITTDAPPMNELIDENIGFLAQYKEKTPCQKAFLYKVDQDDLLHQIKQALSLSDSELSAMSRRARESYLQNDARFKESLVNLINNIEEAVK